MTPRVNQLSDKMLLMVNTNLSFPDWLRLEREKRGWSQSDLGELSGLGRSLINKLESATQNPTFYNAISLSGPLGLAPETILRVAKLLPPRTDKDDLQFEDWEFLLKQISLEDQEEIRKIIEIKIERRKKQEGLKTLKPRKTG